MRPDTDSADVRFVARACGAALALSHRGEYLRARCYVIRANATAYQIADRDTRWRAQDVAQLALLKVDLASQAELRS